MDSDSTYRMIISFGIFVPFVLFTGLLWPKKRPQKHYDSPLLHVKPVVSPVNDCTPCVGPEIEPIQVDQSRDGECFICLWDTTLCDQPRFRLLALIDKYCGTMSTSDLANMIHVYYTQFVHQPGEIMPEYSEIVSHLNGHRISNVSEPVVESILDYQRISDQLVSDVIYDSEMID